MDIRGRCDPIIHSKDFVKCPARIDTALFHFENDYDNYKILEKNATKYKLVIKIFCKKIRMSDNDSEKVIELYLQNLTDNDSSTDE
jgi:hypothetical protein